MKCPRDKQVCGSLRVALGVRAPVSIGTRTWQGQLWEQGRPGWLCVPVTVCAGARLWRRGLCAWRLGLREQLLGGPAAGGLHLAPVCMFWQVDFHPAQPERGAGRGLWPCPCLCEC